MEEKLNKIRTDIDNLSKQEYIKQNYVPIKADIKPKANNIKEKEVSMAINKIKSDTYKMIQKKEQKTNRKIEQSSENIFMDNKSDVFNIIDDDKSYLEWRKISLENRLNILEKYLEDKNYDEDLKNKLREYVETGKISYVKDIKFDKVNQKILDIPMVKLVSGIYIIKENEKKINVKKQNMNNINKLLKINK